MNKDELRILEKSALFYQAIPEYLAQRDKKKVTERALIDLIDALDSVEYARTGNPFFDTIHGEIPHHRKKAILTIEKRYGLTKREGHILRYLANERNPSYIADALGISKATAKTHRYAIYKKLGIHSHDELRELLRENES